MPRGRQKAEAFGAVWRCLSLAPFGPRQKASGSRSERSETMCLQSFTKRWAGTKVAHIQAPNATSPHARTLCPEIGFGTRCARSCGYAGGGSHEHSQGSVGSGGRAELALCSSRRREAGG